MQRAAMGLMGDASCRRPAVAAFALVSCGILISNAAPDVGSGVWLVAALAAGVGLSLAPGVWARLALGVAVVCLGAGWFALRVHETPADFIGRAMPDGRDTPLVIEGVATESARTSEGGRGRLGRFLAIPPSSSFPVRVERAVTPDGGSLRAVGEMRVLSREVVDDVRAGDRVRITGMARGVEPPRNPGGSDSRLWSAQRLEAGALRVPARGLIERLPPSDSAWSTVRSRWWSIVGAMRERTRSVLMGAIERSPDDAHSAGRALLAAMLLGERGEPLRDVEVTFQRLGLAHMLAISGLHLGALAWAALLALRATGDRGWVEPVIIALVVLAYMIIVPAKTPVMRAGIMTLAFLLAEALGRRYDRVNTLAWIGVVILAWRPMELFAAGFQLSFGVVAALMLLAEPLRTRWFGERPDPDTLSAGAKAIEILKDWISAAVAAWAVSAPIIAHHFGIFSPLGAITTVLLAPALLAMLAIGYLMLIASAIAPSVGAVIGPALTALGSLTTQVAFLFDGGPWAAVYLPRLSVAWAVGMTMVIVVWLQRGAKSWRLRIALAVMAAWLAGACLDDGLDAHTSARIDTLAVGDGTCILVRARACAGCRSGERACDVHGAPEVMAQRRLGEPTHQEPTQQEIGGRVFVTDSLLWDCGSLRLTLGEREIPRALRALGAWRVRTVVISHEDLDHYSALPDIVGPLGVRTVLVGESFLREVEERPRGPVAFVRDEMERQGIRVLAVAAGDVVEVGGARLTFLSPPAGSVWRRANDASLVARLDVGTEAGERRFLFTGDIEAEAIASLLESEADLRANVMEAPHHGSARAFAIDFVARLDPEMVVQSTGPRRAGDDRWEDVRAARTWWTTATDGAVSVRFLRDGRIEGAGFREQEADPGRVDRHRAGSER
ncbi:MAG: DUF4131 domain-containing protein [Phycisphaeraceae bacterium]|nr:MAG: DUF4131 domain-containing protein [Phycisphaeraceae bacterium]